MVIVGVDTGGTFTDFVYKKNGQWGVYKLLSTSENPAKAVIEGLSRIVAEKEMQVVHGSTVATNAILERKGVKTAVITNAGCISVQTARQESVRTILSGPGGGVVGAEEIGRAAGFEDLITFDMGGTSTDVCLIDGQAPLSLEASISGYPIRVPMLDVHTVGAGGGSIASIDAGGASNSQSTAKGQRQAAKTCSDKSSGSSKGYTGQGLAGKTECCLRIQALAD